MVTSLPRDEILGGFPGDEFADVADEPTLLCRGDEHVRHQQRAVRLSPAGQRLKADDSVVRQVDDRLVVDDEFVVADRVGKRTAEVALLVGLGEQVVVEKTNLGTGLFGGVHRRVGLTDEVGGIEVGAAAQHGDTDAGPAADPAGRLRRD